MDKAVTYGFLLFILSFLSFATSQAAHRKGSSGSTGRRVETALLGDPSPPQQGIKTRHKPPNQQRKHLFANIRDTAPPLLRQRPSKSN